MIIFSLFFFLESFGIAGSLTIKNPFVNDKPLTEESLQNPNSRSFILQVVKSKVSSIRINSSFGRDHLKANKERLNIRHQNKVKC